MATHPSSSTSTTVSSKSVLLQFIDFYLEYAPRSQLSWQELEEVFCSWRHLPSFCDLVHREYEIRAADGTLLSGLRVCGDCPYVAVCGNDSELTRYDNARGANHLWSTGRYSTKDDVLNMRRYIDENY